jgi:hypothetical protein
MFSNIKTISPAALFLIFGIVIGFGVSRFLASPLPSPSVSQPSQSSPSPREDLRIPRELLDNPVIYEWRADVDGILVEKNKDNFVLERDGKRLVIDMSQTPIHEGLYYDNREKPGKPIQYEDIPLGVRMQGVTFFNPQIQGVFGTAFVIVPQDFNEEFRQ